MSEFLFGVKSSLAADRERAHARYVIGCATRGYVVIDTATGWLLGWFGDRTDAEQALRDCETGRRAPPEPPV